MMRKLISLALVFGVQAFTPVTKIQIHSRSASVVHAAYLSRHLLLQLGTVSSSTEPPQQQKQPDQDKEETIDTLVHHHHHNQEDGIVVNFLPDWTDRISSLPALSAVSWLATTSAAYANDGTDWGLYEDRMGSLIHPTLMGALFLYSLNTAFLGFQWRRQRTMGDAISQIKSQLILVPASSKTEKGGAEDATLPPSLSPAAAASNLATEQAIAALQQERKHLAAANPRDKHFSQGALLVFLGTAIAIEGCFNTYSRAGMLMPGPHLYAGAGLVILWGLAVATVPAMQKGNDSARLVHISSNIGALVLFVWQLTTGLSILSMVLEITPEA